MMASDDGAGVEALPVAEHTLGPWARLFDPDSGLWKVSTALSGDVAMHCTLEDARLIAAAPELASDLRSAWAVLSLILENGWVPEQHRAPVEQCRNNAARSLAKARGQ